MSVEIKEIDLPSILPIRQKVLRENKPLEECKMVGDNDASNIHLGLFYNKKLAGTTTLMVDKNPTFFNNSQLRLRGMAVLPEFQKKQLGKLLLEKAVHIAKEKNTKILWFNARETAVGFYTNFGFSIQGKVFTIKEVGPHFLMFKKL